MVFLNKILKLKLIFIKKIFYSFDLNINLFIYKIFFLFYNHQFTIKIF
jgi:hypothetical protein